jgi:hypothetical protein
MPTVLTWTYVGEHATMVDGDVQRIKAGEIGEDNALGDVTILSFEGGDFTIETGERDADGKLVQRKRTAGHIRAKVNEPGPVAKAAATGRPGQPRGGIFRFYGAAGAAASPTPSPRPKGRAAKGLGKAKPAGKASATPTAQKPAKEEQQEEANVC